ncbi:MAG: type II toxin-antitoxin system HicB family antitoxin [Nostoc sp.]|uniref:type II toxin-antitoxin system HicB family antitoxin n=1 Tax=Nostoc sp. TaxID=1180 RepID=UPI002FFB4287
MKTRRFAVLIYKEDDMYIAECPEVGTVDQGKTIEQAIASLREATQLYLEEFPLPETYTGRVHRKSVSDRFLGFLSIVC